ncbi:MAG TPA: hypothetical protein VHC49_00505 [Mycobacteriales bacterium]|nr:hypothetical protein [Mycobacteriales bacterium]
MRSHPWLPVALLLSALLILAGCGGSSGGSGNAIASAPGGGSSSAPSDSASSGVPTNDPLGFARCMRSHGVDLPDPDPNAGLQALIPLLQQARQKLGVSKLQAAMQSCQHYMAGAVAKHNSGEDAQVMFDYISCLQDHGADIGDPDPTSGRPTQQDLQKLQHPDPATQKAIDACADKRPGLSLGGNR